MKGIFRARPSLPRYSMMWDPAVVLQLFLSWGPNESLSLKQLSQKLVGLLALCQPKRVSELAAFDLRYLEKLPSKYVFHLAHMTKTRSVGSLPDMAVYTRFPSDPIWCPVQLLEHYLHRTSVTRGAHTALLLSYRAPFRPITAQTVSRWLVTCHSSAGIDTSIFKAHSARAASSSKAVATGYPISKVLAAGNWSNKSNTFVRFYHRHLQQTPSFSEHFLRCSFEYAV